MTSETESYRDKAERYENDAKCEIAVGCISGLIGNDAVAMSLSGLAGAYRAAYRTLSDAKRTHELDVAALTKLSGNFDVALESGATLNDLQKSFREMWDQFGVLAAIDVRTPLNNLEASLNAALSSAVKPNPDIARIQRSHIDDLRDRIQVDGRAIQRMLDANPIHALPSSVETAIAKEDITRDIRTELDAIRKSVKERYDQSHELLASISANLNGMLRTISDEQESKLLAADAPNIANELNKARRELRQLPLIVVRPTKDIRDISGQLISQLKDVAGDAILGRINGLIDPKRIVDSLPREDSYPAVSEFGMQPLEIAVVALFWLSLVPLFFQVFIDFGLTTAVIFGVSAMRRHAGRQQT